jgi:hypothetical protein
LQAKFLQDSIHAAGADVKVSLAQFLRNDLAGNFGIQKAIAHGLTNHFFRAAIVGLRPALVAHQAGGALLMK